MAPKADATADGARLDAQLGEGLTEIGSGRDIADRTAHKTGGSQSRLRR
jgi:hypothetical protein